MVLLSLKEKAVLNVKVFFWLLFILMRWSILASIPLVFDQ